MNPIELCNRLLDYLASMAVEALLGDKDALLGMMT
jgi:hypothetical protein